MLPSLQGKKLGITAFAVDQAGRVGYAVPTTKGSAEGNINFGLVDSTLVVYGRTYPLPHDGPIGDIAVDAARGNVFLSNTNFNLLEVWQTGSDEGLCAERRRRWLDAVGYVHLEKP